MIGGGGSTNDLLELQKQSKWLGSRGDIQTRRNNFEKVVHTSPWRFYPKGSGRSTGTTYTTSESLVEDYLERKHRRKKPRTLRPIPSQVRGYGFQTSIVDVRPRYVNNASLKTNQLFGEVTECGAPGINNNNATFAINNELFRWTINSHPGVDACNQIRGSFAVDNFGVMPPDAAIDHVKNDVLVDKQ